MKTKARMLSPSDNQILSAFQVLGGCLFMIVVSQIAIPLPFTPVPITGQTLGVSSLALGLGRQKAVASLTIYLFLASIGFPVLASGKSLTFPGPTVGYLIGMIVSAYVMGSFDEVTWRKSFAKTYFVILIGSVITFLFGLFGLSFYIPVEKLLIKGLYPFILGDFIKSAIAAMIFTKRGHL